MTLTLSLTILLAWFAPAAYALSVGDVNAWQTASNGLSSASNNATSVTYNGYVYEIGGQNTSNNPVTTVSYAPLNSDGSVGSWAPTTSLSTATFGATSVVNNGYIYEIGGENSSGTYLATVYYAKINTNGSLGTWNSTTSLLTGAAFATSVVNNGYVYEMGGASRSGGFAVITSTVSYAPINNDGTIGSWTATTSLPNSVTSANSVVYNLYVYEIGGHNATNPFAMVTYNTISYAPLNSDGTVGSWQTSSNTLPQEVFMGTAVVNNGYVYEMGGDNGSGNINSVYYASLNNDGSVGTWQTASNALPATIISATSVVYNNYLYEIGGYNGSDLSSIYYAGLVTPTTSEELTNAITGSPILVTTPSGTNITCASSANETSQDDGYSYPLGLVNLCFTTQSTNNQVTMTFVSNLTPSEVTARDYNPTSGIYMNIPGAVITATSYNSQPALQLTYSIADNGQLDENSATGSITDPVGLAVTVGTGGSSGVKPPDTGYGIPSANIGSRVAFLILALDLIALGTGLRLRRLPEE